MIIKNNYNLSGLTTLGIGGNAQKVAFIENSLDLPDLFRSINIHTDKFFILGEGSNICLSDSGFNGVVIRLISKGISILSESDDHVLVSVSAGENWDDFVKYTIDNHWWGIENMSLIPGSVGACPVQNVGAYGQDCRSVIDTVDVYDVKLGAFKSLTNKECNFGFRSSIFNAARKSHLIITNVTFKLNKKASPCLIRPNIKKAVLEHLDSESLQALIREAVIKERTNGINLPNNINQGCAGTFFRTAIVTKNHVLKVLFKTMFSLGPKVALMTLVFVWKYKSSDGFKLPSKFLINACGLSGLRSNSVYLLKTNAAVITSDIDKDPSSKDVISLIKFVRTTVYLKTGVVIPIEPTLIGFSDDEIKDFLKLK